MSDLRERAIKDVAEAVGWSQTMVHLRLTDAEAWPSMVYAVSQRERVLKLEAERAALTDWIITLPARMREIQTRLLEGK